MVSTHSPRWLHEKGWQEAAHTEDGQQEPLSTLPRSPAHPIWLRAAAPALTLVAQRLLLLLAVLVIPLARLLLPLDVDLHTVLVGAAVVGLPGCPVLRLLCQHLLGANPGPGAAQLADADPVVAPVEGQARVEVLNLLLVLDCHQVSEEGLAVVPGLLPCVVALVTVVICPGTHLHPRDCTCKRGWGPGLMQKGWEPSQGWGPLGYEVGARAGQEMPLRGQGKRTRVGENGALRVHRDLGGSRHCRRS